MAMIQTSSNRPDTSDPYANPILAKLRNRRYCEDPAHDGLSHSGDKAVWYKVDKAAVGGTIENARNLLFAVSRCFSKEGLTPIDTRVLSGLDKDDMRFTLSFDFPPAQQAQVNSVVKKINAASRALQEKTMGVGVGK